MPGGAHYDVIISGAGPVGLTTAINLGRYGVKCLVIERNPAPAPWPKMDRTNARSMEMFRRLGLADRIRELGYPPDNPMDVFLVTRLNHPAITALRYPSVAECRERIAHCRDGSQPLEPYQLVSQNRLEPLLSSVAEETPNVAVRYGCELVSFVANERDVTVNARAQDGREKTLRASYLVACDGGVSTVRKQLDVKLEGQGRIAQMCQVIFGSDDLYEKIPVGKGRHYSFIDKGWAILVAQGDRKEFTLHTTLPSDTDFAQVIRELVGFPCQVEIRHSVRWFHNLLIAERFQAGRVLMAGDAVHLVIPAGGLGMNSGVGDAFDLSWKLAGVIKGWGGKGLLASYEKERRPVAERNVDGAGWAAASVQHWRDRVRPEVFEHSVAGQAARESLAEAFRVNQGHMHSMIGLELGYSYAGSALIANEPGNAPEWETCRYMPHARPGVRIPHMWLEDGRALQDILEMKFVILDLSGGIDTSDVERAFAKIGAPLQTVHIDEPRLRAVYGRSLFLLRPDMHIAWRGDTPPQAPDALAAQVTGHLSLSG
jgi:2-polyprenyl-6-methoxyphenol hydroxylase-like FAD-dependent oxidoreductase